MSYELHVILCRYFGTEQARNMQAHRHTESVYDLDKFVFITTSAACTSAFKRSHCIAELPIRLPAGRSPLSSSFNWLSYRRRILFSGQKITGQLILSNKKSRGKYFSSAKKSWCTYLFRSRGGNFFEGTKSPVEIRSFLSSH